VAGPTVSGNAARTVRSLGRYRFPSPKTAFAVGAALRMATNVDVAVVQRQDVWSSDGPYGDPVCPRSNSAQSARAQILPSPSRPPHRSQTT
jgi:hypothetical protein